MENDVKSSVKNNSFDFKAIVMGCLNFIISVMLKPISALKEKSVGFGVLFLAGW